MGRPVRSTNKLATALRRKNPDTVLKQLGEMLEGARQTSLARGAVAAEKEREALMNAVRERPGLEARAKKGIGCRIWRNCLRQDRGGNAPQHRKA